jgi:hypothetical protein
MTALGRKLARWSGSCSRSRLSARGYTAVEVLLASAVLLISMAGVMSMQKASIQGNLDARKLDVANSIARTWLDRLAADANSWNSQGTPPMGQTFWLGPYLNAGFVTPLAPAAAAVPAGELSPAFDILGRELAPGDPNTIFCTHVSISTISESAPVVGLKTTIPAQPVLLQATVLVFWPKQLLGGNAPAASFCPAVNGGGAGVPDVAAAEAAKPGTYHMIYASETIRRPS